MDLVSVSDLRPNPNNPRITDPIRMFQLQCAIERLGFLSPLYASPDGVVVSGNQRLTVCQRLGLDFAPVVTVDNPSLELAYLLNRGTNDFDNTDAGGEMPFLDLPVPALRPNNPRLYRCMQASTVDPTQFRSPVYSRKRSSGLIARQLDRQGIRIPIVYANGEVVNGVGRVQYAKEFGITSWPAVDVEPSVVEFARAALNRLSMDFDYTNPKLQDLIRSHSNRYIHTRGQFNNLRIAFRFAVMKRHEHEGNFDLSVPSTAERWIRQYGRSVLDFGSGHGEAEGILRTHRDGRNTV